MQNLIKRIFSILLIAFLLLTTFINEPVLAESTNGEEQNLDVSLTTNLEDGLVTKADKLTFDLWAKDENGNKISAGEIQVTNNGQPVSINWDDTEKTSYTLALELGENKVKITVVHNDEEYILQYKINREFAEDGEVIGTYTFTLEGFTIGLGYIIEPIPVDIIKGENAAESLDRVLKENGFDYDHTGTLTNAFYLSYLLDGENQIYKSNPKIPDILKEKLNGDYDETSYYPGELGEFDFNSFSGWMYAVNNIFPNVGFADYYLSDGDVMRVQYTIALGSDLGGGWDNNFFDPVTKDALTKKIAEINSKENKEDYLSIDIQKEAYDKAINVLQKVNADQKEVNTALENIVIAEKEREQSELDKEAAKAVEEQIDALPSDEELSLSDKESIESARSAYESLTDSQKKLVSNEEKLSNIESKLAEREQSELDKEAAKAVEEQIDALPSVEGLSLSDKESIKSARSAYESLTDSQKELVSNEEKLSNVESKLAEREQSELDKETAKAVEEQIDALPTDEELSLSDKESIESARSAYESLTDSQKELVSNEEKLSNVESKLAEREQSELDKEAAKAVEEQIDALPSVEGLSLSDKESIKSARSAYESLTDSQKELVSNEEKLSNVESKLAEREQSELDKETAKAVEEQIDALPTDEELSLSDKESIESARTAYDSLTETQQSLVSNLDRLNLLEEKIKKMEEENSANEIAAKSVEEKINSLPALEELTSEDKKSVEEALQAYHSLTDTQKELVPNKEFLDSLQAKMAELEQLSQDEQAVNEVILLIQSLPDNANITLEYKQSVEDAREAYNLLTEEQKKSVTNKDKLVALEARIQELEEEQAHDEAAAKKVEEMIEVLPSLDEITLEDKETITKARSAYDSLSEQQRVFVTNLSQLIQTEAILKELESTPTIDTSFLEELIEQTKQIDLTTKTEDSVEALKLKVKAAQELLLSTNIDQKQLDEAIKSLEKAINQLQEKEELKDEKKDQSKDQTKDELKDPNKEKKEDEEKDLNEKTENAKEPSEETISQTNNTPKEQEKLLEKEKSSKELPKTATNIFTTVFIGLVCLLFGGIVLVVRRKRSM
ncbi:DUF4430 domain-containing protein [Pseudogracilibacillus sp. SO30301A]|uniref:DUF4430 domain-containing protein n=1 Tax=Pseudogracilibacillus sp. SO30301A TaxID=3098291 RepID=UPI00300DCA2E